MDMHTITQCSNFTQFSEFTGKQIGSKFSGAYPQILKGDWEDIDSQMKWWVNYTLKWLYKCERYFGFLLKINIQE